MPTIAGAFSRALTAAAYRPSVRLLRPIRRDTRAGPAARCHASAGHHLGRPPFRRAPPRPSPAPGMRNTHAITMKQTSTSRIRPGPTAPARIRTRPSTRTSAHSSMCGTASWRRRRIKITFTSESTRSGLTSRRNKPRAHVRTDHGPVSRCSILTRTVATGAARGSMRQSSRADLPPGSHTRLVRGCPGAEIRLLSRPTLRVPGASGPHAQHTHAPTIDRRPTLPGMPSCGASAVPWGPRRSLCWFQPTDRFCEDVGVSELERRPSIRMSRRQREQRAFRLIVAGGASGALGAVGLVLAIFGVVGPGIPILLLVIAAVCAAILRRTVGR